MLFTGRASSGKLRSVNWDGGAIKDYLGYLPGLSYDGVKENIAYFHDLMRRRKIDRKAGPLGD